MSLKILKGILLTMMLSMAFVVMDQREFTVGIKDTRYISEAEKSLNSPNPTPGHTLMLGSSTATVASPQASQTTPYEHLESHSDTDESYVPSISPCIQTLKFRIGVFDNRFGISKEEFISITEKAADVWETPVGKNLFMYDPQGTLVINLIYDERQERTVDIGYLGTEIENSKIAAEKLQADYQAEKQRYEEESEHYLKDSEAFKQKYDDYQARVNKYNQEGGAPKEIYDKMMIELEELKKESGSLEIRRLELLQVVDSINKKVARYNEFVAYINSLIRKSNTIGAKKFTEGRFTPSNSTIDIYQYSDTTKLQRVIMHELGHALGIMHNENKNSIMYSVNSGNSLTLSEEDLEELLNACK